MTSDGREPRLLVEPFPMPDTLELRTANRQLHLAAEGTDAQKAAIGDPEGLPRPWEPSTCTDPALRVELWAWIDRVVTWHNHQHAWDVELVIPSCWPHHPHLVHDLAVLADLRRRAQLALTADLLEEWHRYTLPAFHERLKTQIRSHCDTHHQPWPARARAQRQGSESARNDRGRAIQADLDAMQRPEATAFTPTGRPRLGLVDLDAGEITPT